MTKIDSQRGVRAATAAAMQGLDGFLSIEKALMEQPGVSRNRIGRGPAGFSLDPETEREVFRLFDCLCVAGGKEILA